MSKFNARKLPSGNYNIMVYCGRDQDGKKIMKSVTAPTRREAEKMAMELLVHEKEVRTHFTVGQAIDGYIRNKCNVLSPSTIHGYEIIRRNGLQSLMNIDIHELTSCQLQQAINEDAATKSPKTVAEAKNLVLAALRMHDVHTDFHVTLPAKKPVIIDLPPVEQVIQMLIGTDIELPCMLAMWLSLRISEVRGLQFRDLQDGVITIQRAKLDLSGTDVVHNRNKTASSTRRIVLPSYLCKMIAAVPHEKDTDFIVPQKYRYIQRHFKKLAEQNGMKLTFHQLRHLNASVMLMLGIPDKYAMERGGWSTPNTLKAVYQHTFSEKRRTVDQKIDEFFNNLL